MASLVAAVHLRDLLLLPVLTVLLLHATGKATVSGITNEQLLVSSFVINLNNGVFSRNRDC